MSSEESKLTTMQVAFINAGLVTTERAVMVNRIERSKKLKKKKSSKDSIQKFRENLRGK